MAILLDALTDLQKSSFKTCLETLLERYFLLLLYKKYGGGFS